MPYGVQVRLLSSAHFLMKKSEKETLVYVGQKAFIERQGKVLVLRDPNYRKNGQVGLDFPGGRFRFGGNPKEELLREVAEETGLKVEVGRPFTVWTNINHAQNPMKPLFLIAYLCKYKSGKMRLSEEHDKFEWVDAKTYRKWKEDTDYFRALEEYFKFKNSDS